MFNGQFRSWNIECELVTPEEVKKLCPLLRIDDLEGGLFIPGDGVVNSSLVCQSLIEGSKQRGRFVVSSMHTFFLG